MVYNILVGQKDYLTLGEGSATLLGGQVTELRTLREDKQVRAYKKGRYKKETTTARC